MNLKSNLLHENVRDNWDTHEQIDQRKAVSNGEESEREDSCSWNENPTTKKVKINF